MAYNSPRSIFQYSNMALRFSGQTSTFGVVFYVSRSLLGIERQQKLKKFTILTQKPMNHVGILIKRAWPILSWEPYLQGCQKYLLTRCLDLHTHNKLVTLRVDWMISKIRFHP